MPDFGEPPAASDEEQAVIMAQLQADAALDDELVRKAAARRRKRKEQRQTREFPDHLERRERLLDRDSGRDTVRQSFSYQELEIRGSTLHNRAEMEVVL